MELTSILLEMVAFFLVTIDLYGRDRLQLLRERMIKPFGNNKIRNKSAAIYGIILFFIMVPSCYLFLTAIPDELAHGRYLGAAMAMVFFLVAMLYSVFYLLITTIIIIKSFSFEGIFIVTGAGVFVISKFLAILKAVLS